MALSSVLNGTPLFSSPLHYHPSSLPLFFITTPFSSPVILCFPSSLPLSFTTTLRLLPSYSLCPLFEFWFFLFSTTAPAPLLFPVSPPGLGFLEFSLVILDHQALVCAEAVLGPPQHDTCSKGDVVLLLLLLPLLLVGY